jgi:hypothetical protein
MNAAYTIVVDRISELKCEAKSLIGSSLEHCNSLKLLQQQIKDTLVLICNLKYLVYDYGNFDAQHFTDRTIMQCNIEQIINYIRDVENAVIDVTAPHAFGGYICELYDEKFKYEIIEIPLCASTVTSDYVESINKEIPEMIRRMESLRNDFINWTQICAQLTNTVSNTLQLAESFGEVISKLNNLSDQKKCNEKKLDDSDKSKLRKKHIMIATVLLAICIVCPTSIIFFKIHKLLFMALHIVIPSVIIGLSAIIIATALFVYQTHVSKTIKKIIEYQIEKLSNYISLLSEASQDTRRYDIKMPNVQTTFNRIMQNEIL